MEKILDRQGRWRNKVVAFRLSPEEDVLLERKIAITGLTKQDYIIRRLLEQEIHVQGNPRVYKALRDQLVEVLEELRRISAGETVPEDLAELITMINTTLFGLKDEK